MRSYAGDCPGFRTGSSASLSQWGRGKSSVCLGGRICSSRRGRRAGPAGGTWRLRPVAERAAVVKRVAELFTERATDLAALITKEMGKRPAQAVGEAEFCTDIFNYYADNGPGLIADKPLPGHER